jgi:hypothetical protein
MRRGKPHLNNRHQTKPAALETQQENIPLRPLQTITVSLDVIEVAAARETETDMGGDGGATGLTQSGSTDDTVDAVDGDN